MLLFPSGSYLSILQWRKTWTELAGSGRVCTAPFGASSPAYRLCEILLSIGAVLRHSGHLAQWLTRPDLASREIQGLQRSSPRSRERVSTSISVLALTHCGC
jgi:hypothetical protein